MAYERIINNESVISEEERKSYPIGIFINDYGIYSEQWESCFQVPGFAVLRPDIPSDLTDRNSNYITKQILSFLDNISDEQIKRTSVMVVDQFFDNTELQDAMKNFVSRLRTINNTTLIVETSGWPSKPIFDDNNQVLHSAIDDFYAIEIINKTPKNALSRINAFKYFTRQAFIQAVLADPENKNNTYDEYYKRRRSFNKLQQTDEFEKIKSLLNMDSDDLEDKFYIFNPTQQRFFLHYTWTILGHLQLKNEPSFYEGSFQRLKQLLQSQ